MKHSDRHRQSYRHMMSYFFHAGSFAALRSGNKAASAIVGSSSASADEASSWITG
jgi:hypothetical protein